jgi:hypothetical protein
MPAVVISASVVSGAISEIALTVVVFPTPKPPATMILTGRGGATGPAGRGEVGAGTGRVAAGMGPALGIPCRNGYPCAGGKLCPCP